MNQELLIFFISIFILSIISFYFGIAVYFLSAVCFIHYFPEEQILLHLYFLSASSATLICIQYFDKNYITKEFLRMMLCFIGGLLLSKLLGDLNVLLNFYKYRINFKLKYSDILAPIVIIGSIVSNKNLKPILFFIMAFTPFAGLYYIVYKVFKCKEIREEDIFISQLVLLLSLAEKNLWQFDPEDLWRPELANLNLMGTLALISGVYIAILFKKHMSLKLYRYLGILILSLLSVATMASNLFY